MGDVSREDDGGGEDEEDGIDVDVDARPAMPARRDDVAASSPFCPSLSAVVFVTKTKSGYAEPGK